MADVQGTYVENLRPAVAGAQADMTPSKVESRHCEPSGGMKFGAAVAQGSVSDRGGKVPASTAVTIGIAMRDRSATGANENGYAQYETMAVMTEGRIWVVAGVDVVAGDPVYVVPTTGVFTKSNASSAVQIPNARWHTSALATNLAVIDLR